MIQRISPEHYHSTPIFKNSYNEIGAFLGKYIKTILTFYGVSLSRWTVLTFDIINNIVRRDYFNQSWIIKTPNTNLGKKLFIIICIFSFNSILLLSSLIQNIQIEFSIFLFFNVVLIYFYFIFSHYIMQLFFKLWVIFLKKLYYYWRVFVMVRFTTLRCSHVMLTKCIYKFADVPLRLSNSITYKLYWINRIISFFNIT